MTANKKYAVFILTHGRPDKVITYEVLRRQGYTGDIYIICDDEDKSLNKYKEKFGDSVIIFSKEKYKGKFDIMDNFEGNKVIVFARNACYDIARSLGLDYFFEYEDDYVGFYFRYAEDNSLRARKILDMDSVLNSMMDCLDSTKSDSLAFAQGGDFIGGVSSLNHNSFKRKAMNSFVFKVNKNPKDDLIFTGRMNDDVNLYLSLGKIGKLLFQIHKVCLVQLVTQSNSGGNTESYKEFGTYVKSFYSVMAEPSCCKIGIMGTANPRIHHSIDWKRAVPKIVKESLKKL